MAPADRREGGELFGKAGRAATGTADADTAALLLRRSTSRS